MDRKIITIGSPDAGEKKFKVEIGNGGLHSQPFCVYAYHEQEALDAAVDYCEHAGWDGLFWDGDESVEEYPDDFVTAGNHCHLLRSDCFHVTQLNETKRNKKNTIRLTESDLKRVISESVKKVLNELDPRTYQWASDERQRRNADVYNQYDPETGESNSQYAAKYKKQGNGDVVRGVVKNAYQQHQNQNTAQQSWAKREQNIGTQQANVEKVNLQKGNYEYVKGYGWIPKRTLPQI